LQILLEQAGLLNQLQGVISVEVVKSFKPDPKVYRHFISATRTITQYTVLVSSNPFDIVGAGNQGWKTIWITRQNSNDADLWGYQPSLILPDLSTLPQALTTLQL